MADPIHYCATLSLDSEEQLFGSAPHKTTWLLLEYSRSWGAKAFDESDLPPAVKNHLSNYLDQNPQANILFIRQSGRRSDHIAFYLAQVAPRDPRLYAWQLAQYEDLLAMDFDQPDESQRSSESLYLVCANAKRDACCATYGLPVYRQMREQVGSQVWQSTHQGGHRFAATALIFPDGIHYGRLRAEDVAPLVQQHQNGHLVLDKLRGHVCYDKPVQAGEYLLRQSMGLTANTALVLDSVEVVDPNCWDMTFLVDQAAQKIRLERIQTDTEIYTSCSNDKTAFVETFNLVSA